MTNYRSTCVPSVWNAATLQPVVAAVSSICQRPHGVIQSSQVNLGIKNPAEVQALKRVIKFNPIHLRNGPFCMEP